MGRPRVLERRNSTQSMEHGRLGRTPWPSRGSQPDLHVVTPQEGRCVSGRNIDRPKGESGPMFPCIGKRVGLHVDGASAGRKKASMMLVGVRDPIAAKDHAAFELPPRIARRNFKSATQDLQFGHAVGHGLLPIVPPFTLESIKICDASERRGLPRSWPKTRRHQYGMCIDHLDTRPWVRLKSGTSFGELASTALNHGHMIEFPNRTESRVVIMLGESEGMAYSAGLQGSRVVLANPVRETSPGT